MITISYFYQVNSSHLEEIREPVVQDEMHGLKTENSETLTAEDGEKIARDLEIHRQKTNEIVQIGIYMKSFCQNTTILLEKLIFFLHETCYGEQICI